MGTHYNVLVFDDHLGMLYGRALEEEAEHINEALKALDVPIFHQFRYIPEANCIAGEIRRFFPGHESLKTLWGGYDAVYLRTECNSELERIE